MQRTVAEELIDADKAVFRNGRLAVFECTDYEFVSSMALAIRFSSASADLKFRALFEGWSQERIIREMF